MVASYDSIFSKFLGKINDIEFIKLPTDTAYEFMNEWLHSAASKTYVRKLFDTFIFKDEIMELEFTLYHSIDDDSDLDFVVEILICGMMIEWLTPRVNSTEFIHQMVSGNSEKFYSQAQHLKELQTLLQNLKSSQKKMICERGYDYQVINRRIAK